MQNNMKLMRFSSLLKWGNRSSFIQHGCLRAIVNTPRLWKNGKLEWDLFVGVVSFLVEQDMTEVCINHPGQSATNVVDTTPYCDACFVNFQSNTPQQQVTDIIIKRLLHLEKRMHELEQNNRWSRMIGAIKWVPIAFTKTWWQNNLTNTA